MLITSVVFVDTITGRYTQFFQGGNLFAFKHRRTFKFKLEFVKGFLHSNPPPPLPPLRSVFEILPWKRENITSGTTGPVDIHIS